MLKKIHTKWLILAAVSLASFSSKDGYRTILNDSFQRGESYKYKVRLGVLNIGEAKVDVSKTFHSVNNRICYLVNIYGRTTGVTDLYKVRNNYYSYIDTTSIIPQKFNMNVSENKFKKNQTITFNHLKNSASVEEKDSTKTWKLPDDVQDVVSSYFYFRTINFDKMEIGQSFSQSMFFDNELYNMRFKFMGKETIKTVFGKAKVFKVLPILPKNKLFDGEEAIRIWVTDDRNRIPLKVVIDLNYVGDVTLETTSMAGYKYPIKWVK